MLRKIFLGIRIVFPFIINTFLYFVIRESFRGTEFALIDTLFYLGVINLIYGLAALVVIRKSTGLYTRGMQSVINLAVAEQSIKDYHSGKKNESIVYTVIDKYLKLIHIVLGILLIIYSVFVYSN